MSLSLWSAIASAGHFLGFFGLAAALAVQLTLLSAQMSAADASRFLRAGKAAAICAVVLILFGLARVLWLEKGPAYYLANGFFWLKMAFIPLALMLALLAQKQFNRLLSASQQGATLNLPVKRLLTLKRLIHWQLIFIGLMVIAAVWMARGLGMY